MILMQSRRRLVTAEELIRKQVLEFKIGSITGPVNALDVSEVAKTVFHKQVKHLVFLYKFQNKKIVFYIVMHIATFRTLT